MNTITRCISSNTIQLIQIRNVSIERIHGNHGFFYGFLLLMKNHRIYIKGKLLYS